MSKILDGKIALITGGTSGIGRAACLEFARQGAKIVLTGRREKEGAETVDLVMKEGGEAFFCLADVSKEADCKKMVDFTLEKFGRLDCAFNNAGTEGNGTPIMEESEDNFHKVMNVNVLGLMMSMKYEIPAMLKNGGGAIVNNGSIASHIGMPGAAVYIASKHAVAGLTKVAAMEHAKSGIRVNTVSPGGVKTDMLTRFTGTEEVMQTLEGIHPIGRIAEPSEIATTASFLCSEGASFITGVNLMVDGGFTVP